MILCIKKRLIIFFLVGLNAVQGGKKQAQVLQFSGNGKMRVGHMDLSGDRGFTLEAWVRLHQLSNGSLFATRDFSLVVSKSGVGFRFSDSPILIEATVVTFVAVTSSPTGVHLYVNGRLATKGPPSPKPLAASDLVIGEGLFGEIFEVRAWAVCREAWEIESGMRSYLQLADKPRQKPAPIVSQDWTQVLDKHTNMFYFFNEKTGESSWILPSSGVLIQVCSSVVPQVSELMWVFPPFFAARGDARVDPNFGSVDECLLLLQSFVLLSLLFCVSFSTLYLNS